MVINSSGIVAVCCLIMYQDVISLSGTIMLHYISSFYHIKKLRSLLTRTLASWTPPPQPFIAMYKTHNGSFKGSQ